MDDDLDWAKISSSIQDAYEETQAEIGVVNILIAGRSGVGKSTLINSVFHGDLARTGQGRPVTKTTRKITKEGVPIAIWDTRGLEMVDFEDTLRELIELLERQAASENPKEHMHVAWLCVSEDGRRVEDGEIQLCRAISGRVPVLGVITKARSDDGFHAKVRELLPDAKGIVRVKARREVLDDGHVLPPSGLDVLVDATLALVPEGFARAFVAAQKVSLERKRQQARRVVLGAAAAAAGVGATPIPFSDAVALVPIQIGMLARISKIYGFDPTKDFLAKVVTTVAGSSAITATGRAIVSNLLKLFPGAGQIVGGMISATTAAALTDALGEVYIGALTRVLERGDQSSSEIGTVIDELKAGLTGGDGKVADPPA